MREPRERRMQKLLGNRARGQRGRSRPASTVQKFPKRAAPFQLYKAQVFRVRSTCSVDRPGAVQTKLHNQALASSARLPGNYYVADGIHVPARGLCQENRRSSQGMLVVHLCLVKNNIKMRAETPAGASAEASSAPGGGPDGPFFR